MEDLIALRKFVDYVLQAYSWDCGELDGGDVQDKAAELGLIELRPIKEEDSIDGEKEHYFVKWSGTGKKPSVTEEGIIEILDGECPCGEVVAHKRIANKIMKYMEGIWE